MMTRAEAYRLLGLKPGASEAEIRRQYKRMALKVHPDTNPDPKAGEQFIRLTKAVEVLFSPEPTPVQLRTEQRKAKMNETEAERKQRMEHARKRYEYQKAQKYYENARYFRQLTSGKRWAIFKCIMVTGWIFALALALDAVLPLHTEKDELTAYSPYDHNGILHDKISAIELQKSGNYFVENKRGSWLTSYNDVTLVKTWILHTPVSMYTTDDWEYYKTDFDFHIGAIRWLLTIAMLVPLLTYFRQRKDLTFVFLYQFSFWGIGSLLVYLLLTENRLVHLLTGGFF